MLNDWKDYPFLVEYCQIPLDSICASFDFVFYYYFYSIIIIIIIIIVIMYYYYCYV